MGFICRTNGIRFRKLTINYGVRFDLYDGLTRADQASPRAGAVYQLFETDRAACGLRALFHAAAARSGIERGCRQVQGDDQ